MWRFDRLVFFLIKEQLQWGCAVVPGDPHREASGTKGAPVATGTYFRAMSIMRKSHRKHC